VRQAEQDALDLLIRLQYELKLAADFCAERSYVNTAGKLNLLADAAQEVETAPMSFQTELPGDATLAELREQNRALSNDNRNLHRLARELQERLDRMQRYVETMESARPAA